MSDLQPLTDGGADGGTCCVDSGPCPTVSLSADVQPFFDAKCVGCHTGGGGTPMNLAPGNSYVAVVGVPPSGNKCGPTGAGASFSTAWARVAPRDPSNSVLWWYVQDCCGAACLSPPCSAATPRCGSSDPICQDSKPTPTEAKNVECWILQGAPNN